jgi:hypothetical protein
MKKITLIASALLMWTGTQAQLFSDNFDSYVVGSYLGPQSANFTTWSGTEGGTEDVKITAAQAGSGANSIYFSSTATNGGPQDVILDFLTTYTTGVFTLSQKYYVNAGKTAYFNIQGTTTLGSSYALDVYMQNGNINVQNGAAIVMTTPYTEGAWFDLTVVCNMDTKIWELKMDGQSVGKWTNEINSVRSVDMYPILNSEYYIDDVSFDHVAYTPFALNATTSSLMMSGNFSSQVVDGTLTLKNTGATAITSFDAVLNYNGIDITQNITGVTIPANGTITVDFPAVTLVTGANPATVTVSNVNGTGDDDATDDVTRIIINPIVPAVGKMVVSEEGTGTWCQWCPRGAVWMDRFEADYADGGYWAGIAVHNNDPMDIGDYDASLAFSGYPSSKVDRGTAVDPGNMTPGFISRIQVAPKAFVTVGAEYSDTTGVLNLSGTFDFQQNVPTGYKVAFVITEDSVTGTTGYAQSNAYAGGGQGAMGGYESLPNPVPASMMVYNHVARDIKPSFGGFNGSFPGAMTAGQTANVHYIYQYPTTWNLNKVHIIALLIAPNGTIENAGRATIAEAITNGFKDGSYSGTNVSFVAVNDMDQVDATFKLYPNPTSANVSITFDLKNESNVAVSIMDLSGKVLATRSYGSLNGASTIDYNTNGMAPGVYMVQVVLNGETMTRRLIVE